MARVTQIIFWLILVSTLTLADQDCAEARVFSFKNENMAAFIKGGAGLSRIGADPFASSSGASTLFTDSALYQINGELGAQFTVGSTIFRLGIEALRPKELIVKGKNAAGNELMTLTSSVFGLHPNLTMHFIYSDLGHTRFFFLLGGGFAQITLDNKYEFTSAGTTAYSKNDYIEKSDVWVYSGQAGIGFETLFVDNVTIAMDFSYRYLPVTGLKHKATVDSLGQGSVEIGAEVNNGGGDSRSFDLGGWFVSLSLQFYINI